MNLEGDAVTRMGLAGDKAAIAEEELACLVGVEKETLEAGDAATAVGPAEAEGREPCSDPMRVA